MCMKLLHELARPYFEPLEQWSRQWTGVLKSMIRLHLTQLSFTKSVCGQSSPIANLPLELRFNIIEWLDDDYANLDLLCFALTCKRLWISLQHLVRKIIAKDYASWADKRFCFYEGSAIRLPDGLEKLAAGPVEPDVQWSNSINPYRHAFSALRYERIRLRYLIREYFTPNVLDEEAWLRSIKVPARRGLSHSALRGTRSSTLFPPNREWVLRNLTLRKYIRLSAMVNERRLEYFHPPFVRGFVDVLYYEAKWTDHGRGKLGKKRHGRWAGHAFDITVLDEIMADARADPPLHWSDVSARYKRLRKELRAIDSQGNFLWYDESDDSDWSDNSDPSDMEY